MLCRRLPAQNANKGTDIWRTPHRTQQSLEMGFRIKKRTTPRHRTRTRTVRRADLSHPADPRHPKSAETRKSRCPPMSFPSQGVYVKAPTEVPNDRGGEVCS